MVQGMFPLLMLTGVNTPHPRVTNSGFEGPIGTPAAPTRQRASEAVAHGPAGSLDNRQDQRRLPWMPCLRPRWPWDW